MDSTSPKIEFKPPQGFSLPEGAEAGKPFDVVCSFEVKEDGTLCMTKIGEADAPGYGPDADKGEDKPDYKPMASGMVNDMKTAGVPDSGY